MSDKKDQGQAENIQRQFEDFVKKRFGDQIQIFTNAINQTPDPEPPANEEAVDSDTQDILEFNLKPKDIKSYLDSFVIQQDEAKKALAIAVCDHYNHIRSCLQSEDMNNLDYAKQNVLILGPTGVGKTYMIRKIADLIGVPFVKADATRFSETGYVGANVDDLVRDLVQQADGDIEKARYGIIYLDEADKLASSQSHGGRDVTGRGVQFGLLRLMEEADVDLKAGNDMQSQIQAMLDFQKGKSSKSVVNTAHILFIVSGAFTGLADIIRKRLASTTVGFERHRSPQRKIDEDNLMAQVSTDDLIEFGFEPEFIGRLPIKVACQHLSADDLCMILKDSKGSLVHQYKKSFGAYGIQINFQDAALQKIASLAQKHKTGARALLTVMEQALRPFKYELPSSAINLLEVTAELVDAPEAELTKILAHPEHTLLKERVTAIRDFESSYKQRFDLAIRFDSQATDKIARQALQHEISIEDICNKYLTAYEHGLKLIKQNTGQDSFVLSEKIIDDPKALLEQMIQEAFQKPPAPTAQPEL